jgi:uncharacterized protein with PQ loop repeat
MNSHFVAFIAASTLVLTVLTKIVGFPSQALQIHKSKSVKNISVPLYVIMFLSYVSWTIHGYIRHDNTMIYGQGLGIITTGYILVLLLYYRVKDRNK